MFNEYSKVSEGWVVLNSLLQQHVFVLCSGQQVSEIETKGHSVPQFRQGDNSRVFWPVDEQKTHFRQVEAGQDRSGVALSFKHFYHTVIPSIVDMQKIFVELFRADNQDVVA